MRSGRIRLSDCLVSIAVLGTVAALFLPAVGHTPPLTDAELNLDGWRPEAEQSVVPQESIRIRELNPAGAWTDHMGWTHLDFDPLGEGRFRVSFRSHGRCGLGRSIHLQRVAEYSDGMIVLDRPVCELSGSIYRCLFSVVIHDAVYLVPGVRISDFQASLPEIRSRGTFTRASQP